MWITGANVSLRSDVQLDSLSTIGAEGDETEYAFYIDSDASVMGFAPQEIFGNIRAGGGSKLQLSRFKIHGSIDASEFAELSLSLGEVTETIGCYDKAEAVCKLVESAGTYGCDAPDCGDELFDDMRGPQALPEVPMLEPPGVARPEPPRRPGSAPGLGLQRR